MCGILGWISKQGNIGESTRQQFSSALETLNHRGLDDHGGVLSTDKVLLGHVRLSILDLSKSGHQPMKDIEDRVYIMIDE